MYDATAKVYYYCNKASHDNVSGIVFTASGANVLIPDSSFQFLQVEP